jgi:hypothetical protein
MRTSPVLPAALLVAGLVLTGCGSDSTASDPGAAGSSAASSPAAPPSGSASATGSPAAPAGTTIDVTVKGGKVTPNGDRVKVGVGEPVVLRIDADEPGEIHVHATPEQELSYPAGTSTRTLTIEQPGIVDVEDHHLETVIVQLQVS